MPTAEHGTILPNVKFQIVALRLLLEPKCEQKLLQGDNMCFRCSGTFFCGVCQSIKFFWMGDANLLTQTSEKRIC